MNIGKEINREAGWSIVLSMLMIAAGMVAIIIPQISGLAVTIFVGWLLILCGGLHLAFAWHWRHGGGLWWGIFLGIIYIAVGCYILWRPLLGLESLTMVLAVYLVLEAVLEVALFYELRRTSGSGWLLFDGVITFIVAGMIWLAWPFSSLWAIGTLVGISMIFSGVSRWGISLAARRVSKNIEARLHASRTAH